MNRRALRFAALLPALLVAHNVADHWVQSSHQAATKGQKGWRGRAACASHVGTYTATTAVTVAALDRTLGLGVSRRGLVAGQLVSAVSHYWADRRFTLARLCERTGKGGFYRLGQPRPVQGTTASGQLVHPVFTLRRGCTTPEFTSWDNPSLGTGAYVLDQAWHWAWLGIAALVTAVMSDD